MANQEVRNSEFDFALSFAGEDRKIAESLFQHLKQRGVRVFYDSAYRSRMLGEQMTGDGLLDVVYGSATRFVVPFISRHYARKDYPHYEFEVARREQRRRNAPFILPIRIDDTRLLGLRDDIFYADIRKQSIKEIAGMLLEKLGPRLAAAGPHPATRWVATFGIALKEFYDYLRECDESYELPEDYSSLCDWLERDILSRLTQGTIRSVAATEDTRNGETYSLRVGFDWDESYGPLHFGRLDWWAVLELLPFDEVYEHESEIAGLYAQGGVPTEMEENLRITRILEEPVSFDFVATPLCDAIAFFQTLKKVNIVLDGQAVVSSHALDVTLRLDKAKFRNALSHMCRLTGLSWHVQDEAIVIS